ncbi:hypothetical protein [Brevundimonas bullata]|uniref:hypothetical protein n=1 Tax=Brevundimonas bullata TaxID=13160 RepID=UPI003D9A5AE4
MNAVTTQAPRPQIMAGGQVSALVPQSLDEAFRVASAMAASGMTPKGVDKPEQVLVAIMAGAELGFAPFQAMQSFAVINGKPNIWGDALPALLWSRGFKIKEWFDNDDEPTKAFCRITRPDGDEIERSFSVGDAKKAGLLGKQGPWQQYQKRMLQMRARAFAARDGAADVLRGMHVAEEVQDYQPITSRRVPSEGPNLAARLSAPSDAPREGFTSIHGAEANVEASTDFDAASPSEFASNQPASDAPPSSDAGDTFPGDSPSAGETTASGPEAEADEEKSLAVDVIAWADKLIEDLPFLRPEQIEAVETDRKELAKFAVLKATDMARARELEAAIKTAKEG